MWNLQSAEKQQSVREFVTRKAHEAAEFLPRFDDPEEDLSIYENDPFADDLEGLNVMVSSLPTTRMAKMIAKTKEVTDCNLPIINEVDKDLFDDNNTNDEAHYEVILEDDCLDYGRNHHFVGLSMECAYYHFMGRLTQVVKDADQDTEW